MSKKHVSKNEVTPIVIGLVVSIIVIIACGKVLISEVNSDKSSNNEITSSVNSIPQEVTSITEDEIVISSDTTEISFEETKETEKIFDNSLVSAKEVLGISGLEIEKKFAPEYENFGRVSGGYTIGDDSVYPYLQIVVTIDENNNVADVPVTHIRVLPNGRIDDSIFVGMTYNELKEVLGDKIQPIESDEENCMFAAIMTDSYDGTIEFEFSGGKSVKALIMAKQ